MRYAWLVFLFGCSFHHVTYSSDLDRVHMYGDRLDAGEGRRILAWVADHEGERIRWVYDVMPRPIDQAPIHTWPGAVQARGDIASVIVILPPGRSSAMRDRVRAFMQEATRKSENAGRHVVVGRTPWYDVNDGNTLHARLMRLHAIAERHRATSAEDGVFLQGLTFADLFPDYHVVPLRESKTHFAVYGNFAEAVATDEEVLPPREMTADAIVKLASSRKQTRFHIDAPTDAPWVRDLVVKLLEARDDVFVRVVRDAELRSREEIEDTDLRLLYPFVVTDARTATTREAAARPPRR